MRVMDGPTTNDLDLSVNQQAEVVPANQMQRLYCRRTCQGSRDLPHQYPSRKCDLVDLVGDPLKRILACAIRVVPKLSLWALVLAISMAQEDMEQLAADTALLSFEKVQSRLWLESTIMQAQVGWMAVV